MGKKVMYCIAGLMTFVCVLGLCVAYQMRSGNIQDATPRDSEIESETEQEPLVLTEGTAKKEDAGEESGQEQDTSAGYYLRPCNGYVGVYLAGEETVYEYTNISMDSLPEEIARKIQEDGYYVETEEQLYGFLENYSS